MRTLLMILILAITGQSLQAQEVIELQQRKSNKIIVKLQFRNGSVTDPIGKEGLTALTASVVNDGGTATMTKSEIDEFIYPMAASYGVSVDKELTVFTFQFPSDFEAEFYPIIKELMLSPAFSESDFNRVKSRQLNYVTRSIKFSNDEDYAKVVLEQYLYEGTRYAHLIQGNKGSLDSITLENVQDHWADWFTRSNLTIGIAGRYTDGFRDKLVADMKALPELKLDLPEVPQPRMPEGIEVKIISKPGAFGSAISMGFPLEVTRANDDFVALMVPNSWLGEHRKSYGVLYNKIRETRSMNYGDYSYLEWYPMGSSFQLPISGYVRTTNYFSIWIRPVQLGSGLREQYEELADTDVGHAPFAIRMALRELHNLIENGLSNEDFERTRTFLRSYMKLYIKSPNQRLGYLLDSRIHNRLDWIAEADRLLEQMSRERSNKALQQYLQSQNILIAIITSPDEAAALTRYFTEDLPSPMTYSNLVKEGLPIEVLEEDEKVSVWPIKATSVEVIPNDQMFLN
jgi:zinc protease